MTSGQDPFRFSSVPRWLPVSIRLANWFNAATQVALAWTLFSTPFFWLFTPMKTITGLTIGSDTEVRGRITRVEETGASENDASVYAVYYAYFAEGERFEGVAYSTGSAPSAESTVTVYYDEDNPKRSKVDGLRRSMFGWGAIFVVIFPAVGVIGLWFTIKWGVQRNRLLSHGLLADGKLEKTEATNTTINDRQVMALTFSYQAKDGIPRHAVIKTADTKWLTDDEVEQILYDPDHPDRALGLDELDPFPDFDEAGRMRGSLKRAVVRSILPALTLAANLFFIQRLF